MYKYPDDFLWTVRKNSDLDSAFITNRELKRELEQKACAADSLKYSRFAGIWKQKPSGWVVYHFGQTNIQLNESGEFNARLMAEECFQGYASLGNVSTLILGSSTDVALSILRYTEWYEKKNEGQRKHLKNIHYHLPMGYDRADSTYFLSIGQSTVQMLALIKQTPDWDERMETLHNAYLGKGAAVCGILDCKLKYLYCYHAHAHLQESGRIMIVCYDWQQKMVEEYFRDIADRMEIWIQPVSPQTVWAWFYETEVEFPMSPYRLSGQE